MTLFYHTIYCISQNLDIEKRNWKKVALQNERAGFAHSQSSRYCTFKYYHICLKLSTFYQLIRPKSSDNSEIMIKKSNWIKRIS